MSKEFDKLLNKNLSQQDREKLSKIDTKEASTVDKKQSPGELRNSYTPHPKDAGKQDRAGQEATIKDSGNKLKQQGVEAEKGTLSKYSTQSEKPQTQEKQQTQEKDNER